MHDANHKFAQRLPKERPKKSERFTHNGRRYSLNWQSGAWRVRCRAKSHPFDWWSGLADKQDAIAEARLKIDRQPENPIFSRRGGGNLEALATVYLALPKRVQQRSAEENIGRLRTVCRLALGRELAAVTCREVGQRLWETYQCKALAAAGHPFDYSTRYRENIAINSCIRAAKSLFLKTLIGRYREQGLDVSSDANVCQLLPEPELPPAKVDDTTIVSEWRKLERGPLWQVLALARFAGLRREEISAAQAHWIDVSDGVVSIYLCDRPDENWWTKTGKPYHADVIDPEVAAWLIKVSNRKGPIVVVGDGDSRSRWFERAPQRWLHRLRANPSDDKSPKLFAGIRKPLHRLRGLYADHIALLTADARAARLKALRAAQKNLGHTTTRTTEKHYTTI